MSKSIEFFKRYFSKPIKVTPSLQELFGDEYAKHIKVGRWYYYSIEMGNMKKLKITYARSNVFFYVFKGEKDERFFELGSFMSKNLLPVEFNPKKELGLKEGVPIVFDDTYTKVLDWENK